MSVLKIAAGLLATIIPLQLLMAEEAVLSSHDMIQQLTPKAKAPATRGWGDPALRGVKLEAPAELPAIDLHILFEFGSDHLTPAAKTQLTQLGRALTSSELVGYRFDVAGHTDAVGDDDRNMRLSRARAVAVRHYLMQSYGIEGARLQAKGYGERKLADANNPESGVNRRVQIINTGKIQ